MSTHGFVGDLLIRTGVTDASGLTQALELQSRNASVSLGRALADLGLADESLVASTIASALSLEYLGGDPPVVRDDVVALLPAEFCRKHRALPLSLKGNLLRLALTDPLNYSILQDVEFRTGKKTASVVVTQTWLERMSGRLYPEPNRSASYDMFDSVTPSGEVEPSKELEYDLVDPVVLAKDTKLPPIVRLVNLILSDAAKAGASDVHVEPNETFLQVRQRVDGLLREVLTIPHHLQDQAISRLKIISGMDIAERRKPQDGRCRLIFEGRRIDLRVSTLPTQFGEKVVIRLLNADKAVLPIEDLGLAPANLRLLQSFLSRPQGMILVTGPTGSGKTSTLYSALNSIKSPTNNIITLEDPIEFQVPGVNQMQINTRAGVTFASGLRSILRQDPNVILVGEIRDEETANIALEAAQTGHLLLSTLHTNDAPGTITRLLDLGVQPFLIASSLVGIVAQRLVRRPCPSCAVQQPPSAEIVEKLGGMSRLPSDGRWVAGKGCDKCGQSGLKGRMAVHEILQVNDEIRELISNRAAEHVLRKAARRGGMRTLIEDGIEKAAQSLTTLEEVLRVVAPGETRDEGRDAGSAAAAEAGPVVAGSAGESELPAGPRRVLIVEDNMTIVTVVKYFLELEGFEVMVANTGLVGLEMALRERPDVIVSDVNMPGMNGLEMVKALRLNPRTANVRVLMLTSEATVDGETEGLAAGADDYILKPVEPRRLAARVKALLMRSRPAA
ncbi:MAG TPA: ATPase, T2SS/T4P/T4SS family [Vicinamibacterales bacterium]|jgi:type IV pilus assembly protein PilB|nr:ATPase, T2SS/T4P/T4SS family [Vicinamibacterales bacterium]